MIKPKINGTNIVIGPCRLSYVYVFEKYAPKNGDPAGAKYSVSVLIPKGEKEALDAIREAIEEAKKIGIYKEWAGKLPKNLDIALRDGDAKDGHEYDGNMYVNAKTGKRPGVVDRDKTPITDEEDIYSGVWAYVSIGFYPYRKNGKDGIACSLNNIMKFKDDEKFGGAPNAEEDFSDIDFDDEEDL